MTGYRTPATSLGPSGPPECRFGSITKIHSKTTKASVTIAASVSAPTRRWLPERTISITGSAAKIG